MWREQLASLYPLVAVFLVAAVFVLYVHYTSAKHYRLKLLLGPALLAACFFTVPLLGGHLGYGWPTPLPVSFQYIAHKTVVVQGEKRWIDVLLVSRRPMSTEARLHRIRWSRQVENVLEDAERMKEGPGGGEVVVTGPAGASRKRDGQSEYSTTRVLPGDQTPKSARPAAPESGRPPGDRRPPVTSRPDLVV